MSQIINSGKVWNLWGRLRCSVPSFVAADAVDVALKAAVVYYLREDKLLKGRHGAGIEAELFVKKRSQFFRQHHVTHAHGRGNGARKCVQVYNIVVMRQRIERFHGLGGNGELRTVVRLDDKPFFFVCPADILMPF